MHMPKQFVYLSLSVLMLASTANHASAQELSALERQIADAGEAQLDDALALLERTVNVNSGTLNASGNKAVADILAPEFEALGFDVRWEELPSALNRSGHLIAERAGTTGRSVLLIGHLDTVFEPDSPFQEFTRDGDTVRGPGVLDMKGGNVVILYALKALAEADALTDTTIRVIFTGDEERPGRPLDVTRASLIELAQASDVALGFENGSRDSDGDLAVVARRSSTTWALTVTGVRAHSSGVFGANAGAGAIFETSRILSAFYGQLRGEQYLTFNVGVVLGGSDVEFDAESSTGTAGGKTNVVPEKLVLEGDIRTISTEQLMNTRDRMRRIVANHLPRTSAEIEFREGYPPMSPADTNYEMLSVYSDISRALGYGEVRPFDPGQRGAADVSFAAPQVGAALDGLGPQGGGGHTVDERLRVSSIVPAIQRAALLIYRLTH